MSRISDSMRTRIEKLKAKIAPMEAEIANLVQAVNILEKEETITHPAATDAATSAADKEPSPTFLKRKYAHD